LKKFDAYRDKLPNIKAFIVWGEELKNNNDPLVYSWKKFLQLGKDVSDKVIFEHMDKQNPS
jgi:hypothetical protein